MFTEWLYYFPNPGSDFGSMHGEHFLLATIKYVKELETTSFGKHYLQRYKSSWSINY